MSFETNVNDGRRRRGGGYEGGGDDNNELLTDPFALKRSLTNETKFLLTKMRDARNHHHHHHHHHSSSLSFGKEVGYNSNSFSLKDDVVFVVEWSDDSDGRIVGIGCDNSSKHRTVRLTLNESPGLFVASCRPKVLTKICRLLGYGLVRVYENVHFATNDFSLNELLHDPDEYLERRSALVKICTNSFRETVELYWRFKKNPRAYRYACVTHYWDANKQIMFELLVRRRTINGDYVVPKTIYRWFDADLRIFRLPEPDIPIITFDIETVSTDPNRVPTGEDIEDILFSVSIHHTLRRKNKKNSSGKGVKNEKRRRLKDVNLLYTLVYLPIHRDPLTATTTMAILDDDSTAAAPIDGMTYENPFIMEQSLDGDKRRRRLATLLRDKMLTIDDYPKYDEEVSTTAAIYESSSDDDDDDDEDDKNINASNKTTTATNATKRKGTRNVVEVYVREVDLLRRTMNLLRWNYRDDDEEEDENDDRIKQNEYDFDRLHYLIGYNSFGYDVKYLLLRCAFYGICVNRFIWRDGGYSCAGFSQIPLDLFRIVRMRYSTFKRYTLSNVARELLRDDKSGVDSVALRYTFAYMLRHQRLYSHEEWSRLAPAYPSLRDALHYNNYDTLLVSKLERVTDAIGFLVNYAHDLRVTVSSLNSQFDKIQYRILNQSLVNGLSEGYFLTTFKDSTRINFLLPYAESRLPGGGRNYVESVRDVETPLLVSSKDLTSNTTSASTSAATASSLSTNTTTTTTTTTPRNVVGFNAIKKKKYPGGANFCLAECEESNVQCYDYRIAYPLMLDRLNLSDETCQVIPADVLLYLLGGGGLELVMKNERSAAVAERLNAIRSGSGGSGSDLRLLEWVESGYLRTFDYLTHSGTTKSETRILYFCYLYRGLYSGGEFEPTFERLIERTNSPVITVLTHPSRRGVLSEIISKFNENRENMKNRRKTLDGVLESLDEKIKEYVQLEEMNEEDEYEEENKDEEENRREEEFNGEKTTTITTNEETFEEYPDALNGFDDDDDDDDEEEENNDDKNNDEKKEPKSEIDKENRDNDVEDDVLQGFEDDDDDEEEEEKDEENEILKGFQDDTDDDANDENVRTVDTDVVTSISSNNVIAATAVTTLIATTAVVVNDNEKIEKKSSPSTSFAFENAVLQICDNGMCIIDEKALFAIVTKKNERRRRRRLGRERGIDDDREENVKISDYLKRLATRVSMTRDECESSYRLQKSQVASVYGCIGRLKVELAALLTALVRITILSAGKDCIYKYGGTVLYIDTDSIFVIGMSENVSTKLNGAYPYTEIEMKLLPNVYFVRSKTYYTALDDGSIKYGQHVNGPAAWRSFVEFIYSRSDISSVEDARRAFVEFYLDMYARLVRSIAKRGRDAFDDASTKENNYDGGEDDVAKRLFQEIKIQSSYKTVTPAEELKRYLRERYPALAGHYRQTVFYYFAPNDVVKTIYRPRVELKEIFDKEYSRSIRGNDGGDNGGNSVVALTANTDNDVVSDNRVAAARESLRRVNLFKFYYNVFKTIFNLIKFHVKRNNLPYVVSLCDYNVRMVMLKSFLAVYNFIYETPAKEDGDYRYEDDDDDFDARQYSKEIEEYRATYGLRRLSTEDITRLSHLLTTYEDRRCYVDGEGEKRPYKKRKLRHIIDDRRAKGFSSSSDGVRIFNKNDDDSLMKLLSTCDVGVDGSDDDDEENCDIVI